jgi:membrane-associated phospholipid phosphatase
VLTGRVPASPERHTRRRSSRGPALLAAVALACYVTLTVVVATRATQGLDAVAREFFRPHDEWGPTQVRADVVVEGLKPRNIAVLVPVVGVLAALYRRSWRPLVYVAGVAGLTGLVAVGTKLLLLRPDTHGMVLDYGGSYPSGHAIAVMVSLGTAVLVLTSRSRWWQWVLVGLAGLGMSLALLVQATHWLTDVLGGLLLAVAVLAAASRWPLRSPVSRRAG